MLILFLFVGIRIVVVPHLLVLIVTVIGVVLVIVIFSTFI